MIEDLQGVYENKISSLKPEKTEIIHKHKQNNLNQLEVENERLDNALFYKNTRLKKRILYQDYLELK